jgi:hypothetical protein
VAVGVALASLAVATASTLIGIRVIGWNAAPGVTVQITPGFSCLSRDERGTDAFATVKNPNRMPVDVTLRVRGLDITERPVIEKTVGPFRNIPAGGARDVQVYLDATPLTSVKFETVAVRPVPTLKDLP